MGMRILLRFIVFLLSLASVSVIEINAQDQSMDVSSIDFSKIKVDDITDEQIGQLLEKASENGYTQQQIASAALAKGMPQTEVQKLKLRMNTYRTLGSSTNKGTTGKRGRTATASDTRTDFESEDIFSSLLSGGTDSLEIKEDPRAKVFGYSLFNTENLTFEPSVNIPTPKNYILGAEDEINIDIWGASQQSYQLTISPDGNIIIENVGPVFVSGLTIEEASILINKRLYAIYTGLRGPNPNTFSHISLGNLRSINVILLGEVYLPGSYTLSSLSRVFNALYLSGGPNINGSLRNIEILRDNRVIDSIDVYDFLFKGNIEKNILLRDQDIIKINPYTIRVISSGEVKRPLIYEMKSNETLSDLIRFSGGFSDKAYTNRLKIIRNTPREKQILDVSASDFGNVLLKNGDSIVIEPVLERFENRVEIKGAVYRPGEFAIQDTLTLLKLLEKAEGLKGDAFLSRAVIYRTKENYTMETIPVDLEGLISKTVPDIILLRDDLIVIPSIFDLREEYFVEIDGEVRNPGRFPFMYNTTIEDIILEAGGLLESASMARIEVARRVKDAEATSKSNKVADIFYYQITKDLKISGAGSGLVLEPFDRIFIRRSPGYEEQLTATIEGEILFPGEYSISNKDERISDIINRSGGLTPDAYPKGASLIRYFSTDEKERTKAIQSSRLFREYYSKSTASNDNFDNVLISTSLIDSKKQQILDSIVLSATKYRKEQTIGIDLEMILAHPHTKYDLIIKEGDRLVVPKLLQTVSLSGGLLHPISARYDERNVFRDYIRSAGGFAANANKPKSYVIYANGSVDVTRSIFGIKNYPKVEPGAEIVVPTKEKRVKSPGEWISMGSALASMTLLIVTVINSTK